MQNETDHWVFELNKRPCAINHNNITIIIFLLKFSQVNIMLRNIQIYDDLIWKDMYWMGARVDIICTGNIKH